MKLPVLSRRKILQLGALLSSMPALSFGEALAWPVRGIAQTGFNGGKSQTNFNFLGQGEFPFLNLLKESGTFKYVSSNAVVASTDQDANGYPNTITNGGQYAVCVLPTQLDRPGNYVLSCVGNGAMYIGGTNTAIAYSVATASKAAQCVLTLASVTGAPLKAGQEVVVAGATGTGWSILNATQTIVSIDVTGLLVTINLNTIAVSGTLGGTITAANTKTVTQGFGRYVFTPGQSDTSLNVGIQSIGSPRITDLKLYHIDDEALVLAGKVFGVQFKARLKTANFGVYRNLNWPNMNTSPITNWASRKPTGYITYQGQELRSTMFCSTVSVSAAQLTVTGNGQDIPASGGPTDRMRFSFTVPASFAASRKSVVTFTTATSTVNWASHGFTGGESVSFALDSGATFPTPLILPGTYYVLPTGLTAGTFQIALTPGGSAVTFGGAQSGTFTANANPEILLNGTTRIAVSGPVGGVFGNSDYPAVGDRITVVYDLTFNKYLCFGGGVNGTVAGIDNGVPLEIFFQLCVEMGAHPYWVMPYLAGDPMTDWLPSLMQYCKDNAPSWMVPRFEGTNETWNTATGFFQTSYALNRGSFYGWSVPSSAIGYHNYYGKLMSVMGQAGATIFGGANLGTKYHIICGVQTSLFVSLPITSQDPRLTSALYVSGGVAQSPLSGSWGTITFAAVAANTGNSGGTSLVSHICCAQYTSPSVRGTLGTPNATENTYSGRYNGKVGTATVNGSVLTYVTSTLSTAVLNGTGLVAVGDTVYMAGVPNGTTVSSLGTGTGGAGSTTYNLSQSAPTAITSAAGVVFASDLTAAADYDDSLTGTNVFATNDYVLASTGRIQTWANGLGVKKICGYEGCYSPDYQGSDGINNIGKTQIDLLRWGGKNVYSSAKYAGPTGGLQKITKDMLDGFVALTGGGLTAEFPSNYLLGGPWPSIFVWSVFENVYTARPSPQMDAHAAFNA